LLKGKFKKRKKKERKVITAVNPIEEDPFASKASIEGPCAALHVLRWNVPQTSYQIERLTTKSTL
jgi:transcription elongation GreA/GreB family factor